MEVLLGGIHALKRYMQGLNEFFWNRMRNDIRKFIRECEVCQRNKTENLKLAGLLQPVPVPNGAWIDISMDFVEGVTYVQGV